MRGRGLTLAWAILAVALVLSMATPALAQSGRGTISGVVKDASGSVVPGVSVTATNRGTNAVTTVTTNADGLYSLRNLPIGTYSVNFTLSGFAPYTQEGITLAPRRDHHPGPHADGGRRRRGGHRQRGHGPPQQGEPRDRHLDGERHRDEPAPQLRRGAVARELRLRHRAERRGQQLDVAHQRGGGLHQGGRPRRHLGGHPDRRAHRRVQPPDGGGRGVHGPDERDPRGVRAHGRRRLQLLPQVGHEPVPGKRLRLPPQRGPERQHVAEQLPGGDGSRERRGLRARQGPAVPRRGEPGRADHQGQDLLLPGRRGVPADALPPRGPHPDRADRADAERRLRPAAQHRGRAARHRRRREPHLPGGDPRPAHRPRLPRQRHPREPHQQHVAADRRTSTGRGTCPRPTGSSTTRPSPTTTTPTSSSTRSASR